MYSILSKENRGLKRGFIGKEHCCSSRKPKFSSQHPCLVGHNHWDLQLLGLQQPLLGSWDDCCHVHITTDRHIYTLLKIINLGRNSSAVKSTG